LHDTYNPITFISTLCNSPKLPLLPAVLSFRITEPYRYPVGRHTGASMVQGILDGLEWFFGQQPMSVWNRSNICFRSAVVVAHALYCKHAVYLGKVQALTVILPRDVAKMKLVSWAFRKLEPSSTDRQNKLPLSIHDKCLLPCSPCCLGSRGIK